MSWFSEVHSIPSEKNGTIRLQRTLGRWEVYVKGIDQTSEYCSNMWKKAFKMLAGKPIKRVLLLGLGGGDVPPLVYRFFPNAHLTAVEWDPVMIDIAKKIGKVWFSQITVVKGDAIEVVANMKESYDLVISDLFIGRDVSPICNESYFSSLKSVVKRDGTLVVNVFSQSGFHARIDPFFSLHQQLKYRYNILYVYRHSGQGKAGDPLPKGYQSYRTCEAYMRREVSTSKNTTVVAQKDCVGFRSICGPFRVDKFFGEGEPVCDPGNGLLVWRPIVRVDRPVGWMQSRYIGSIGLTGFSPLHTEGDYWERWSSHAQRHRKKWKDRQDYSISSVSVEDFLAGYRQVKKDPTLKTLFSILLKKKIKAHGNRVRMIGIRGNQNESLLAGFASLDIPEIGQSLHLISFIHPSIRHTSAGVGMMDDWFVDGFKKKLRFLDFGLFWSQGEPRTWKPFSRFKAQFGIHYIMHPNPLMRFFRS